MCWHGDRSLEDEDGSEVMFCCLFVSFMSACGEWLGFLVIHTPAGSQIVLSSFTAFLSLSPVLFDVSFFSQPVQCVWLAYFSTLLFPLNVRGCFHVPLFRS